ncbi:hypothetical protein VN97_g1365 [Penicillium thymicola]|uniref:Uncharacterized protein n=1 Tax=Penicillium thymicola TaxID=293382 RepID=A0AAI9TRS8_PENTH|nr:hypothetical protein VN97_g1365 [Penicillium thymicola]
MTNHNLLTTSKPHQFIKCNVSPPSIFHHADEMVVSTQIRHDKTHNMAQTKIASMQQDCHNPQTPKKQKTPTHTHTQRNNKNTRRKGNKSKQSSTPLKRPLADGHGIIEWKHVTSKDNPTQHGLDFTTLASHSISQRHIGLGRMDMGNMGGGWTWECTNEVCFDVFGMVWDFICIQHLHLAPSQLSFSSNFASMDIINVRVTVDICLGGWFNLFCIYWKY